MRGTLALLLAAASYGQEPTFQAHVHKVIVPVSVLTKAGKPVETLNTDDFLVLSDGKPQTARIVSRDSSPLPVYAVIVVQVNATSGPALAKIKKTASLISTYITNDMNIGRPSLAAVVTVNDEVKVAQDFTSEPDTLGDTFAKISPTGGSSRVIDGVSLACDLLAAKDKAARRVVVLISEASDLQSKAHFADVVVKAQREDVVIYTLSYSAIVTAFTQKASERPSPPDQPGLYDPSDHQGGNMLGLCCCWARKTPRTDSHNRPAASTRNLQPSTVLKHSLP